LVQVENFIYFPSAFYLSFLTGSPIYASTNGPMKKECPTEIVFGEDMKIFFLKKSHIQRIQLIFTNTKMISGTYEVSISYFDDSEQIHYNTVTKMTLPSSSFCFTEGGFEFSLPVNFLGNGVLVNIRQQLEKETTLTSDSATPTQLSSSDLRLGDLFTLDEPKSSLQIQFFGLGIEDNKKMKLNKFSRVLYLCQTYSTTQQIIEIVINPNFPIALRNPAVHLLSLLFQLSTSLFLEFLEKFEIDSLLKSCYSLGNATTSIIATGILCRILLTSNVKLPHRIFRTACDLLPDVLSQCSSPVCIDQYFLLLEKLWDLNPNEMQQAVMNLFVSFTRLLHENRSYTENILHTYFGISSLTFDTPCFDLLNLNASSLNDAPIQTQTSQVGMGIRANGEVISKYPANTSVQPVNPPHNSVVLFGLSSLPRKAGHFTIDFHSLIQISSIDIEVRFNLPDTVFHLIIEASNDGINAFPFPLYHGTTHPSSKAGSFPPHHHFHISGHRQHRYIRITLSPESNGFQGCHVGFEVMQSKYSNVESDDIETNIHNLEVELQNQYEATERSKKVLLQFLGNIGEPLIPNISDTLRVNVLNSVEQFREAQRNFHSHYSALETTKEIKDLRPFVAKKREKKADRPLRRRLGTKKQLDEPATPICESSTCAPTITEKTKKDRLRYCVCAMGDILLKKWCLQRDQKDSLEEINPSLRVCLPIADQQEKVQFFSELFEQLCLYQGQRIAELGLNVLIRELQNFFTTNEIVEWLLGRLFEHCKRPRAINQIFSQQRVLTLVERHLFELNGLDSAYNILLPLIESQIGVNNEDAYNSLVWMLLLFQNIHSRLRKSQNLHIDCKCANCGLSPICGIRYRCVNCVDFDLCQKCEGVMMKGRGLEHPITHLFARIDKPLPLAPKISKPNSDVLLRDLYLSEGRVVTESRADLFQRRVDHEVECRVCYEGIHGVRYKCLNCQDFDVCEDCVETKKVKHFAYHIFLKVVHPLTKKNTVVSQSTKLLQNESESVSESISQEIEYNTMKEGTLALPTPNALVETLLHPLLYGRPKRSQSINNNNEKKNSNDTDSKRVDESFGSPLGTFEGKRDITPKASSNEHPLTGSLDAPRVRFGMRNSQSENECNEREFHEGREDIGIILSLLDTWALTTTMEAVPVELMLLAFEIVPQLMTSMKETTSELLGRPCFDRLLKKAATSSPSSIFRMKFLRMVERLFSPENYGVEIPKSAPLAKRPQRYYQFLHDRYIATNIASRIFVHFLESFLITNELMMFFLTFLSIITKPLPFQETSFWNEEWKKLSFQRKSDLNDEIYMLRVSVPEESRGIGELEQRDFHFVPDAVATYLVSIICEMQVERSIFGGSICILLKRSDIDFICDSNTFWKFVRSILVLTHDDNSLTTGLFPKEFLEMVNSFCLRSFHFRQKLLDLLLSLANRSFIKHPMICDLFDFISFGCRQVSDLNSQLSSLERLIITPTALLNLVQLFSSSLSSSINSSSFASSFEGISQFSPIERRLLILFSHYFQKLSSESLNDFVTSLIKLKTFHQIVQIICSSSRDISSELDRSIIMHLVKCDLAKKEIIKECVNFFFSLPRENVSDFLSEHLSSEELIHYFAVELGGYEKLIQMISETLQKFESEKLGLDFFFFFFFFFFFVLSSLEINFTVS
jgi:hypothetical protein